MSDLISIVALPECPEDMFYAVSADKFAEIQAEIARQWQRQELHFNTMTLDKETGKIHFTITLTEPDEPE